MKVLSKLDSLDNIQDGNTRKLITKATSSGSGNAVTAVSVSGDTITYTKGSTFLTGHQNAFSNVKVGNSTVAADQAGDTLELAAGSNITLTPDTTNDKITIAATVPTKTSELTNDSGFITSYSDEKVKQTANTSSNSALRVLFAPNVLDTDYTGNVNKNSNFTYNPSTKALATGGTVDGYKLAAASAKGVDTSIAAASTSTNLPTSQAVASFVEGKGYTSNTGTITGVSVNGTSVATSGIANITAATGVKGDSESSYRTGNVNITKANIGLGNVENKSSATIRGELTSPNVTTALGYTPIDSDLKGANNGLAELDANGKVPSSQLPSYVDDVLEYTSQSAFPATGETGKIYIAQDTNKTYRWSGTAYTEISSSLALGETSSTAYRGDRGKIAYDHSQSTHARTDATATAASTTNGNIKINGTETTVYTHPNSGVSAGTYKSVTVNAAGHVTAGSNPTTLSGYGITDAKIASGIITLGSDTITPLTSSSTLNATKLSGAIPSAVTATTQIAGDNSTKIATTAYADGAVSNRLEKSYSGTNINGTALWSGNSLVSTVINTQTTNGNSASLSDTGIFLGDNSKGKLKISNGTNNDSIELGRTYNNNWYGLEVDSSGVSITGLKTPTNNTDAVNKQYVDNNHSIKDITNGNIYIGNLESGYYNVFAGVTLYASEETAELVLSVGRKAFMYVSHELSNGEDTVSYWILNDETDVDVNTSEYVSDLNNWGQILYQGVFVDSTGDFWRNSFSLKQADYVTAYDVADNLTTNNSRKVLSARQGYLLNQNKQNTILSGTTNPTSDLGVNGDVYIKYSAS